MTTNEMTPADLSAVMGGNDNFGGNGSWWILLLFIILFGGYGRGFGGGSGANDNYVLSSDFAITERKLDSLANGICDLGYTQAQLINQNNISQLTSTNAIQSQIAQCCCDTREAISGVNYNNAMNTNTLQSAINTGFCQTNFNGQTNTRDIIDAQNANTRAILDAIESNKVEALKDRIAEQNQTITALNLASSQQAQNAYLIDKLGYHCPQAAYVVQPPQSVTFPYSNGCGCNA